MTNEVKIVSLVALATTLLIGVTVYFTAKSAPTNSSPSAVATPATNLSDVGQLVRSDSYSKGDENAKVTVVEFADFQCEACKAAYPAVKQLMEEYKGKGVKLTLRNFPLPNHKNSQIAANAAEAAGEQGKYWEMHDILFENQEAWTADPPQPKTAAQAIELMMQYGQQLGLDMEKFKVAVESRKFNEKLSRDMADGEEQQVTGTPTFFVNGKKLQSITELRAAIDSELAR